MIERLKHEELSYSQHLTNVSACNKITKSEANAIACNAIDKLFDLAPVKKEERDMRLCVAKNNVTCAREKIKSYQNYYQFFILAKTHTN